MNKIVKYLYPFISLILVIVMGVIIMGMLNSDVKKKYPEEYASLILKESVLLNESFLNDITKAEFILSSPLDGAKLTSITRLSKEGLVLYENIDGRDGVRGTFSTPEPSVILNKLTEEKLWIDSFIFDNTTDTLIIDVRIGGIFK